MDQPEARKAKKVKKPKYRPMYGPFDTRTPLEKIPGNKSYNDLLPVDLWIKIFRLKKQAEAKWVKDVGFVHGWRNEVMRANPYGIPGTDNTKYHGFCPSAPLIPSAMAERLHYKYNKIFIPAKHLGPSIGVLSDFAVGDQNGLKRKLAPYKIERGRGKHKQIQYILDLEAFDLKVDDGPGYKIGKHDFDDYPHQDPNDPKRAQKDKLGDVIHFSRDRDMLRNLKPWPKDKIPPRFIIDLTYNQDFFQKAKAALA